MTPLVIALMTLGHIIAAISGYLIATMDRGGYA
jgi:hypothetical protein